LKVEKPIIAFLYKDPGTLQVNKTESTEEGKKKLIAFRDLVQKKMCKYWMSPAELGSVASRSLIQLIKSNPGIGWIKADQISSEEATKEILRLRQLVDELQTNINKSRITPPKDIEQLAQGNDVTLINVRISAIRGQEWNPQDSGNFKDRLPTTWNKIFSAIGPILIDECSEKKLRSHLNSFVSSEFSVNEFNSETLKEIKNRNLKIQNLSIEENDFQTIKIQLRALGLMTMSQRKNRSVKDTATYWTLTPYGDEIMNRLRAIKRPSK